ncbi:MAG: HEPN domain-containing protein, partial [Planctomycetota bacterium]
MPPLLEDIAFHRQRGAEKSFKAFPAWHGVQFGKTHDLGKLGILAIGIDSALEPFARSAAPLTAYAVLTRYPSEGFSVSDRAAREAENLARKVFSGLPGSVWVEHPPWDPGGTGTRERPDPS